jgi:hypothetical protein
VRVIIFQPNYERNPVEEMHAAETAGKFHYIPPGVSVGDDFGTATAHEDILHPTPGIDMSSK